MGSGTFSRECSYRCWPLLLLLQWPLLLQIPDCLVTVQALNGLPTCTFVLPLKGLHQNQLTGLEESPRVFEMRKQKPLEGMSFIQGHVGNKWLH